MKKLLLSSAAAVALSGATAMAADMPLKAPPAPACPTCDWTGFYIGVNAGGGIGRDPTSNAASLFPPGTFGVVSPGVINPLSGFSYAQSPAGAIGGAQIGVNWQTGNMVLGAEADWDASGQRDRLNNSSFLASSVVVASATTNFTDQEKIDWLATARLRLGWANDFALWYVTGGAAWGRVDSNYTFQGFGSPLYASAPGAANFSTTRSGYAVGGGVETTLSWLGMSNHWSAKIEYLYVNLGSVSHSFGLPVTSVAGAAYTVSGNSNIRDNLVRAGLNYRFGDFGSGPKPVAAAAPCPTCNWTGYYIGGNVGGSIGHDRSHDSVSLFPPGGEFGVTNPLNDTVFTHAPIGVLGGGQVGINWQTGNWVLGAEADWDKSAEHDTFSSTNFIASTVVVAPTTMSYTDQQKIEWLATARARLGWAQNCFLWYVTGGAAWGRIDSNYTFQSTTAVGTLFTTAPGAANFSATKSGWTIGGGVETSLVGLGASNHWSAKLEYLYVDLGSINNAFGVPVTTTPTAAFAVTSSSNVRDHIVRVGLNYRFGP